MMPKKKLSASGFAVGVLLRAVTDAAEAPARAETARRITAWVEAAKARYLERVEGIPVPAAEECATTAFSLRCVSGTPGRYHTLPPSHWPDPVAAADEDMAGWNVPGEAA